jgi:hypothetical protein
MFDSTTTSHSVVNDFVVIVGTPVHGFNPSKEALAFVQNLPDGAGKRSVCFAPADFGRETQDKMGKVLKRKN